MSFAQICNAAVLLGGSVFCMVAALCFYWGKDYEPRKRRWMIWMQLSTALLLFSDANAYLFRGAPGAVGYWMVRISNFLVFLLSDVTLLFFHCYVGSCLLGREEFRRMKRTRIAVADCILGMVLVILSQFTGLYYTFDADNIYHRAAAYPISMVIPVITMLIDASLLWQYRTRISRRMFLATGSYIVLPLVGAAIQSVLYGPSLINLMIWASMVLMFEVTLGEQTEELRRMENRQTQLSEKLEIATMLNRCVERLSDGTDMDSALNNLMEIVRDYFQADRSYLFEITPKNALVNTYEAVKEGITPEIDNLQEVPVEVIDHWMEQFRKEQIYYMDDVEQEKGYASYEMLRNQNVWRLLAVPLRKEKQIIGFLGLDNPREHAQDPTLLASIQFFITNSLEQRNQQKYLEQLSYSDMLTHLRNRNGYIEDLNAWKGADLQNVGGLYIDLNGLKKANDSQGHEAGDALICRMAAVLEELFPQQAYRIGGDEFVVLLQNVPQDAFAAQVQHLRKALQQRNVSAAVGAVWEANPADLETMMREADDHMYREKERQKRCAAAVEVHSRV